MKKIFSKILIAILILGFFFAPVTPKIDIQNHFSLVKNEVFAEDIYYYIILAVDGIKSVEKTTLNLCQEARDENLKSGTSVKTPCLKATSRAEIDAKIAEIKTETTQQEITEINKTYDGVLGDNFFNCEVTNLIQCVVAVLYGVIWVPISWITQLSAQVLDFFIFYSLQGSSYETKFVESGWAIIRDISNLFFIVALLYVAGKTVLGLNASNNKKVITMVIMMALLINFSLFISKVVIDASNILARVFYNSIENVNQNNQTNVSGEEGEKQLTVGLVKTFNPQSLFIASGITNIDNHTTVFVILLLISGALMVYMIITFLSIAFLFVGRVVGLWILMIFAPLAFASYTMPSFKIPKFGNQEWWSSLFNLSFTAPIFIFFLYLIISFGDAFKIVTYGENGDVFSTGVANGDVDQMKTYLSVIVPFALVYVLLKQAKETTTKMAGEIAQGVNNAGQGLAKLALGGAALGTAVLGRATVGRFIKGASTGDTAATRLAAGTSTGFFDRLNGQFQSNTGVGRWINRQRSNYGERLNRQGNEIAHASHARHDLDQMASTITHGAKKTWSELNGQERLNARVTMERNDWIRNNGQQNGFGNRTWANLSTQERNMVNNAIGVDNHGQIINNISNLATNNAVADGLIRDARRKVGTLENIEQSAIGGSFDIRGLAKIISSENDSTTNKVLTGTTSLIAQNMRLGLKNAFNGTTGESQKNFFKDLSKTLTEALKSVKLNVDLSNVGHEEKDGHGGHGGGHGGGGHH